MYTKRILDAIKAHYLIKVNDVIIAILIIIISRYYFFKRKKSVAMQNLFANIVTLKLI